MGAAILRLVQSRVSQRDFPIFPKHDKNSAGFQNIVQVSEH